MTSKSAPAAHRVTWSETKKRPGKLRRVLKIIGFAWLAVIVIAVIAGVVGVAPAAETGAAPETPAVEAVPAPEAAPAAPEVVAPAPAVAVPAAAPPVEQAPAPVVAPPAPAAAPAVGSAEWLLATLRTQDAGFATVSDEKLIELADNTCDYRESHDGATGTELARIAQRSGFTAHQGEVLSTTTYVYCVAAS